MKAFGTCSPDIELVEIPPITSIQEYSKFIIKELVNYVDTTHVLCTQWDAFILNCQAWTSEWLEYDYIGAPWWFHDSKNVGNGGFSLRSKKFLQAACKLPLKGFHPEDVILCRTYKHLLSSCGIQFASEDSAVKFSLEGNVQHGFKWNGQFGFHDFSMTDISAWEGYNDLVKDEEMRKIQFNILHPNHH